MNLTISRMKQSGKWNWLYLLKTRTFMVLEIWTHQWETCQEICSYPLKLRLALHHFAWDRIMPFILIIGIKWNSRCVFVIITYLIYKKVYGGVAWHVVPTGSQWQFTIRVFVKNSRVQRCYQLWPKGNCSCNLSLKYTLNGHGEWKTIWTSCMRHFAVSKLQTIRIFDFFIFNLYFLTVDYGQDNNDVLIFFFSSAVQLGI